MKKLIKSALLSALIAAPLANAGTETGAVTIRQIATGWEGSELYVWTDQSIMVEGCTSDGFIMPSNHRLADEMMSMMLSAFHAGTTTRFYIEGCMHGRMKIQSVKVCNKSCE